jgi:hypothetical protein
MIQAGLEWLAHALVGRSVSASTLDPRTSHVVPALAQIGLDEAEKVGAQPRRGFGRRGNRAIPVPLQRNCGCQSARRTPWRMYSAMYLEDPSCTF